MTATLVILIIGANRGIGFELVCRLISNKHTIIGTYRPQTRDDASVAELMKLNLETLPLDFINESSIIEAARQLGGRRIDVLINCDGIYKQWDTKPFTDFTSDDLLEHFQTNTIGPFLTSKYFLPHLSRSPRGKIINISSDFASIADNTSGNLPYRLAKTALNQLTRTCGMDLKKAGSNVITLSVHPGYLPTKMTDFGGTDDMEMCMSALVSLIERFGEDPKVENGGYVQWDGEAIAW